MDISNLGSLARNNRIKREAGVAILLGSLVLSALLFFPMSKSAIPPLQKVAVVTSTPHSFANIHLRAKAAIVYDLATHKILYAKNANAQLPLASITKLLTTYEAVKELGPNAPITITAHDVATEGNSGFSPGETFHLASLARITLTASLNDGAAAMARVATLRAHTSTSHLLASAASAIGLSQTYALDGSGLDLSKNISGGYGSAHDVALLAGAFLKEAPYIAEATTHLSASATSLSGTVHTRNNTNHEVATTEGILLSKTGYTDLAGGNLVVIFDASINHPIAVVALGSTEKDRFTDVDKLIAATRAQLAGIKKI